MTNLTKIRGLQRGSGTIYDVTASGVTASGVGSGFAGPASVRGFRVPLAMGRHYRQNPTAVSAALTSGTVAFTASYPGTWGNNISVAVIGSGSGQAGQITVNAVNVSGSANMNLFIYAPTGTTSGQLVSAVQAHPVAGQLLNTAVGSGYSQGSAATNFSLTALSGGSNGSGTQDAEPGPQTQGVAGEPIFVNVTNRTTWVVDTDDQVTARALFRNKWRWLPVGPA